MGIALRAAVLRRLDDKNKKERDIKVMETVRSHFRPEFLNRLDDIVIFDAINKKMLEEIIDIQLSEVVTLLKNEKDIVIKISKAAQEQLMEEGFDPAYGVRPLKRAIQSKILDLLAESIIKNEIKAHDHVLVEYANKKFTLKVS